VSNTSDGHVEGEALGEKGSVDKLYVESPAHLIYADRRWFERPNGTQRRDAPSGAERGQCERRGR
jgi:hypothetical protein